MVVAEGFATTTVPGVQIPQDAGTVDTGPIELLPGVEVAGRVVDAEGRPVDKTVADSWRRVATSLAAVEAERSQEVAQARRAPSAP